MWRGCRRGRRSATCAIISGAVPRAHRSANHSSPETRAAAPPARGRLPPPLPLADVQPLTVTPSAAVGSGCRRWATAAWPGLRPETTRRVSLHQHRRCSLSAPRRDRRCCFKVLSPSTTAIALAAAAARPRRAKPKTTVRPQAITRPLASARAAREPKAAHRARRDGARRAGACPLSRPHETRKLRGSRHVSHRPARTSTWHGGVCVCVTSPSGVGYLRAWVSLIGASRAS